MKQLRNYSLWASAMLTLALTSCNTNEIETIPYEGPVPAQVTASIDKGVTRAHDTTWESGDAIGIYCSSTNTIYNNKKYVTANGNGSFAHDNGTASGIFFQGTDDVTFSAYYPFSGADGTNPGTDGVIAGSTRSQSSNQSSIDYMYAGGVTTNYATPTISFTGSNMFKHKMARLILVLSTSPDDGLSADEVKASNSAYTLGGLKHEGTFNVMNGIATATAAAAVDGWSVSTNCTPVDDATQKTRTYTMILYPQTLSGALPFTANINNKNYRNTADIKFTDNTLSAGTSYTFTITIRKTGLTVSGCSIEGWGTGENGSGNALMGD